MSITLRNGKTQIIFALILAVTSVFLVLLATQKYGPGVSSDSTFYLSSAENFVRGRGFINFDGGPLVDWPPLYSFLLGVGYKLTGIPLLEVGRLLNAIFTGLTIIFSALVYQRGFRDRPIWFYLGILDTFLFLPLLTTAANISTDLIFLWFEAIFFLAASEFLTRKTMFSLLIVSIISACATMLRWVGYLMILTEIALIVIAYWKDIKKSVAYSLAFGGLAALPFLTWVLGRNYLRYHTFFGPRDTGLVSIPGNIVLTYVKLNHWFFPLSLTPRSPAIFIWGVILIALFLINRKKEWLAWLSRWVASSILPILIFSVLYYVFITLTIYTGDHLVTDFYDDRLQSPLFFSLLVGIFFALDELVFTHIKDRYKKIAELATLMLFVIWSVYPATLIFKFEKYSLEDGVIAYNNYNTKTLNESGLVEFLRSYQFDVNLPIYTNYSEAVYLFTGQNAKSSPKDMQSYTAVSAHLTSQLTTWPPEPKAYLIWFKSSEKRSYYNPRDLSKISSMDTLYDGKEGQMYIVVPK